MEDLLQRGELPNIARYLVEKGSYQRATTVFPSTTGPAYLPFLTGCFPGRCNMPGIRWFDRREFARTIFSTKRFRSYVGPGSSLQNYDITPGIKTLFELVERPVNVISAVNKGSGFSGNVTKFGRMLYLYYAHLTDRWSFVDRVSINKLLKALDRRPEFAYVVLPAIDEYAHLSGPFSPSTVEAYRQMDRLIGEVIEKLQTQGRLEQTVLMISSDHGLSDTRQHFGVDRYLESKGLKTFYYPLIFKRNVEAAYMVSGNGMGHVHWRGRHWGIPVTWEDMAAAPQTLAQGLIDQQAVDFVAGRNAKGEVVVLSQRGEARIARQEDRYAYFSDRGDALGLKNRCNGWLTSQESLEATFSSDYPDALVQLTQIFDSPRSGDLIVSARPGFDLRDRFESPEHKASHGSLHREHMHVPLVSSVPLVGGALRTVDVFPTILEILGKSFSGTIDGVSRCRKMERQGERHYVRA